MRRPPNSNREPIPNHHQLGIGGKICGGIRAHEVGHSQAVVNLVPFETGQEGDPGLVLQAEPLIFRIPPKIIQEGNNMQED